jgi:hypothetical protein
MGEQPWRKAATCTGKHKTQKKRGQTFISRLGSEPTIPMIKRAKTFHALDRTATVIGVLINWGDETELRSRSVQFRSVTTSIHKLIFQNSVSGREEIIFKLLFPLVSPVKMSVKKLFINLWLSQVHSKDSAVGIATRLWCRRLRSQGSITDRSQRLFSSS